jgi:regulator-associated protein of mTOR
VALRRAARDERAVFYYNGHGVPKPTPSGEIWVFNKSGYPCSNAVISLRPDYTQYIPVSLYDLQDWLGR